MEQWNPETGRPVLSSVPIAVSSPQEVNRAVSLYYIMVGSLAEITQTSIKDLLDNLSKRKDLFRFGLKKRMKEAYQRSEKLMREFKNQTTSTGQYQLWLDVTDAMEENLKPDIQRLYYTTDNIMLKNGVADHDLQTMAVVAYNLSVMLHDISVRYDNVMDNMGIRVKGIKPYQTFTDPMYGMYASMREVCDFLIKDKTGDWLKQDGMICKAMEVIALKICDFNRLEAMSNEGLKVNGIDWGCEDNQDNSFTVWNTVQDRFLAMHYKEMSDEELAKIFGRSVGSIKARMRKLKLKR